MKQVIAPADKRLVWYLAMEEYLARQPKEEILSFWTVDPTVIFGRHQVMKNEVNIDYCNRHGVAMYRRKSGGGCVYSDRGNLMISYISPSQHSEQVFGHYLTMLSDALRQMGYPAVCSSHNDILVNGHKVSGNACFALPEGTIVHGTMMWNVDFQALEQAITPSAEKLAKHGVESVRQRVVNLCAIQPLVPDAPKSITDLQQRLANALCTDQQNLPDDALQAIDEIEQTYLDPRFRWDTV